MFERYTEKARRVIFFARYESSQFGSQEIEPEHLLLGLMRESRGVFKSAGGVDGPNFIAFRQLLEARSERGAAVSTSVDLPLSEDAKRCLFFGAEEAEEMGHRHIGSEHLLLGILRVERSMAAQFLEKQGMSAASLREELRVSGSADTRLANGSGVQRVTHPLAAACSLSPESVHALAFAMEEAKGLGQTMVSPGHLLLGLLRQGPSETAELLTQSGITEAGLRERLGKTKDKG